MYGKIFEAMYDGSLHEDYKSMLVFMHMIILADENGIVDMTPRAMSARTGTPIEYFEHGIPRLESPDNESRTPDEDGRRIVRLDEHRTWGWEIVNYMQYRNIATREDKKRADRERLRKKRAAKKDYKNRGVAKCRKLSQNVRDVAHTDTDTDIYSAKIKMFETFWSTFNDKRGRKKALESWLKIPNLDSEFNKIITGAKRYNTERQEIKKRGGTPKMAQGWLTDRRWEDEVESSEPKRDYLGKNKPEGY